MLFTFWQTLLDRIEHLEKLCDKKEKFLQVSTSRRGGRGGGRLSLPSSLSLFSSSHSSLPLQSTKMILKFRETHISNLEKARRTESPTDPSQEAVLVSVSLLKHLQ